MFEYANKNKEYIKTLQTKIGITADGIAGKNGGWVSKLEAHYCFDLNAPMWWGLGSP